MQRKMQGQLFAPQPSIIPADDFDTLLRNVKTALEKILWNLRSSERGAVPFYKTLEYQMLFTTKKLLNNYQTLLPFSRAQQNLLICCYHSEAGFSEATKVHFKKILKSTLVYAELRLAENTLFEHKAAKTLTQFKKELIKKVDSEIDQKLIPTAEYHRQIKKTDKIIMTLAVSATVLSGLCLFRAFSLKTESKPSKIAGKLSFR